MKYSLGFRASIVRKTQDGSGRSVYQVAKETGISPATVSSWINQFRNGTLSLDGSDGVTPGQRSPGEKLSLLLESKTLSEDQFGEWIRTRGLHTEHLPLWEQELTTLMNDKQTEAIESNKALRKENKRLKEELQRKDKALAEAAVLLTLKKKYHHLFDQEGSDEDS